MVIHPLCPKPHWWWPWNGTYSPAQYQKSGTNPSTRKYYSTCPHYTTRETRPSAHHGIPNTLIANGFSCQGQCRQGTSGAQGLKVLQWPGTQGLTPPQALDHAIQAPGITLEPLTPGLLTSNYMSQLYTTLAGAEVHTFQVPSPGTSDISPNGTMTPHYPDLAVCS